MASCFGTENDKNEINEYFMFKMAFEWVQLKKKKQSIVFQDPNEFIKINFVFLFEWKLLKNEF